MNRRNLLKGLSLLPLTGAGIGSIAPLSSAIAEEKFAKRDLFKELGNLSVGSDADVAILNVREGKFGLFDYTGYKLQANKRLESEMTIKGGVIVYDLNGIANPVVLTGNPAGH